MTNSLRDHSKPCREHGLTGVHSYDVMTHPDGSTVAEFCPGGREVTIDYEAAAVRFHKDIIKGAEVRVAARNAVDAALGGGDE